MCRLCYNFVYIPIFCTLQTVRRIFLTLLLAIENLTRMAIHIIYNAIAACLQTCSMLPVLCVYFTAQKCICSHGLRPSCCAYQCSPIGFTAIMAMALFLILYYTNWIEDTCAAFGFTFPVIFEKENKQASNKTTRFGDIHYFRDLAIKKHRRTLSSKDSPTETDEETMSLPKYEAEAHTWKHSHDNTFTDVNKKYVFDVVREHGPKHNFAKRDKISKESTTRYSFEESKTRTTPQHEHVEYILNHSHIREVRNDLLLEGKHKAGVTIDSLTKTEYDECQKEISHNARGVTLPVDVMEKNTINNARKNYNNSLNVDGDKTEISDILLLDQIYLAGGTMQTDVYDGKTPNDIVNENNTLDDVASMDNDNVTNEKKSFQRGYWRALLESVIE